MTNIFGLIKLNAINLSNSQHDDPKKAPLKWFPNPFGPQVTTDSDDSDDDADAGTVSDTESSGGLLPLITTALTDFLQAPGLDWDKYDDERMPLSKYIVILTLSCGLTLDLDLFCFRP